MPVETKSDYEAALEQLLALGHELHATPAHKFDLAHMRALLGALGNPQEHFKSVLIAGTNGKGSTAATLFAMLRAAGVRAGLYTSPHLVRPNERIRTERGEISDQRFGEIHAGVERAAQSLLTGGRLPWHPSFFEMLTAMAFLYFWAAQVEIAVLEVGMGGRLDATNVVEPTVSVITDVALDHQNYLGNTIAEIAGEKAGIIHQGGVVVTLSQHPEANQVIGNAALARGARLVNAAEYVPPEPRSLPNDGAAESETGSSKLETRYSLAVLGREIKVASPLVGRHQRRNVALAIAAAVELAGMEINISAENIEQGIRETHWPGRFQVLPAFGSSPAMVLDVAHNPAGAWALRAALSERYAGRPLIFVFGAMRDKPIAEMAQILFPLAATVIATRADTPRAARPQEICQAAGATGVEVSSEPDALCALRRAREIAATLSASNQAKAEPVLVVTGSIYLVGEVIKALSL